jgi:hypothetical protein
MIANILTAGKILNFYFKVIIPDLSQELTQNLDYRLSLVNQVNLKRYNSKIIYIYIVNIKKKRRILRA